MRTKLLVGATIISFAAAAQDSLRTTTLREVVITGTKFDVPVEKSGKTIYKLDDEDLRRNAGKTIADLLNEVPGIQTDGNFGTPGSNISYYLRGARNKHTLILIDGVPLNDPTGINAEYDLRFVPLAQVESVEVLKGGLSTLYGTNASAGVINIKLKEAAKKFSGAIDLNAASYDTYGQDVQLSGTSGKLSYLLAGNHVRSKGFSAALDANETGQFDRDGFDRKNVLAKLGVQATKNLKIGFQTAYERFDADYDNYEFTDAKNTQTYRQVRFGVTPELTLAKGNLQGKFFYNTIKREFHSSDTSVSEGKNFQAEVVHRHKWSNRIQTLAGVNLQRMGYSDDVSVPNITADSATFTLVDPYASVFIDLPSGLNIHAGARLNTHSEYGTRFLYNINPSFLFNKNGRWQYKALASLSTSFVTPSLYQLFGPYGNAALKPEESLNYEAGASVYHDRLTFDLTWFKREETNPIDFVSIFDNNGNYVRGQYDNLVSERNVSGWEFNVKYQVTEYIAFGGNFTTLDSNKPSSLLRIPKTKYGFNLDVNPLKKLNVTVKYHFTGERQTSYFLSAEPIVLKQFALTDVFASYDFLKDRFKVYGAVNNVFDKDFVAVYGYTTRGRNFSAGVRYQF